MPPKLQSLTFLATSFAGGIALTLVLLFVLKPNIIQDLVGDNQNLIIEEGNDNTTIEETQESLNQDRSAESEYLRHVSNAETSLSYLDPNTRIRFPLGVNHPLSLSEAETENFGRDAIGYISNSGEAISFTAGELIELFSLFPELSDVQDVSDIPTIDLIFLNPQNNGIYSAPKVSLIGVFRDLVNSLNNQTIEVSEIDLTQLSLNSPRNSQSREEQE